jgi:extracellular elastinolytic metalloproteinase
MRLFLVPLLLAGLSAAAVTSHPSVRPRKSLGFGPVHPHARFSWNSPQVSSFGASDDHDPFVVALDFANGLIPLHHQDSTSFVLRKDSYTDKNTGVTHAYLRQFIHGLEVADGDVNVNIVNGLVFSYGNSVCLATILDESRVSYTCSALQAYQGALPGLGTSLSTTNPHAEYCEQLIDELRGRESHVKRQLDDNQIPLGDLSLLHETFIRPIEHIFQSTCAFFEHSSNLASKEHELDDPRHALLQFMVAATPEEQMVQDILARYDDYIDGMTSTFEPRLVGDGVETPIELINNVPDTTGPVKARLAYIQVPHGDSTKLDLVWKFEVEMKDNWYEAAVSANAPHKIISVVDWASDAYAPIPKERQPATYNVFTWGINDPSVGSRSMQSEKFDSLASPAGWHSLHVANDPQSQGSQSKHNPSKFRNTSNTYGNNVSLPNSGQGNN